MPRINEFRVEAEVTMRAVTTHELQTARGPPPIESQINARAEFDNLSYFRARKGWCGCRDTRLNPKRDFRNLTVFQSGLRLEKTFNLHHTS